MVTAADNPRALNDPVGLMPSSLMYTPAVRRLSSIGVNPSPSVTGSASGSTAAYRHMLAGFPASDSRVNVFFSSSRS